MNINKTPAPAAPTSSPMPRPTANAPIPTRQSHCPRGGANGGGGHLHSTGTVWAPASSNSPNNASQAQSLTTDDDQISA